MNISDDTKNLISELKTRCKNIDETAPRVKVEKVKEIIVALYVITCGSVVVANSKLAGRSIRSIPIDRVGIIEYSGVARIGAILGGIILNLEQISLMAKVNRDIKCKLFFSKYLNEMNNLVNDANIKIKRINDEKCT
jgi:hypothetical protein